MSRYLRVFVFFLLLSTMALADEVQLKNGDRITGRVTGFNGTMLQLNTQTMGDVSLYWDKVLSVKPQRPLPVTANGITVQAVSIQREANNDVIVTETNSSLTVARGCILSMTPLPEPVAVRREEHRLSKGWNSTLDAGFSTSQDSTKTTALNVNMRAARTTDNTRLSLNYYSLYSKSESSDGTILTGSDNKHGGLRYEVNVSKSLFAFGFGNFESDVAQKLDLQDVFGAGAGRRIAQNGKLRMDVFSGVSLDQESFASSASTSNRLSGELLFGQDSSYAINGRNSISSRLSLYPNFTLLGEYRAALDASASTRFNQWLGWQVTVSDRYTSNPVAGSRVNTLTISTGLRVNLGREKPFRPHTSEMKFTNNGSY